MAYSKTIWQNGAAPALDAAHLNNIEDGIEALDVRVSANEADIAVNTAAINTTNTNVATNTGSISTINNTIASAAIIRTGTFNGTWSPTLGTTFNISNYTDYNWTVSVNLVETEVTNHHTLVSDAYLDVDGNTLRLIATDNGSAVSARYQLIGIKKTMSDFAQLNQ